MDPPDPPLGIEGRGGLGKSVLVAAVARDPRITENFPDGVFWITVGQAPNLLAILEQLLREFGAVSRSYADTADARQELLTAISDKRCLVILDDIWDSHHAKSMLVDLHQKNLINLDVATGDGRLMLHDLQHDYLQLVARKAGRLAGYHQSLLDGYRRLTGDN